MKQSVRRPWSRAAALLIALSGCLLIVLPWALRTAGPRPAPAPVAANSRSVMQEGLRLLGSARPALAEVPAAMAVAAGRSPSGSHAAELRVLDAHPALDPLAQAMADPRPVTTALERALQQGSGPTPSASVHPSVVFLLLGATVPGMVLVAGGLALAATGRRQRSVARWAVPVAAAVAVTAALVPVFDRSNASWGAFDPATQSLEAALGRQQIVVEDVIPAVEDGGLAGGRLIPPPAVLTLLAGTPALGPLNQLVTGASELYGAETTAIGLQSETSVTAPSPAARDVVFGAGLAAILGWIGVWALAVDERWIRGARSSASWLALEKRGLA